MSRGGPGWVGGREETTNLLSALLIMLVRVKLASGSKKGARGRAGQDGRGEEGDVCSLALTSAGEGRGSRRAPRAGAGMGRQGRWAGRGARETRGRTAPPPARAASRSVKLNKEGICCS